MDVLRQIDNQREIADSWLVDGANWVVDEVWREENSQWENLDIVIWIFVKSSKTFCINDQNFDGLSFRTEPLDRSPPDPHTLRARIDGWANTEPTSSVEEHPI